MSDLVQEYIDKIQYELDLEELSRLTESERSEIAEWAATVHYETYHGNGPLRRPGVYACCIFV